MPKNPSTEQRIEWHIERAKNCKCRQVSAKLAEEIKLYEKNKNSVA